MRLQDYMIEVTQQAANDAFKAAKVVPPDKLDWKPLENGRSVLDQCRELAICPQWAYDIIQGQETAAPPEGLNSVEACEAECNRRLATLFDLFRTMPDERLAETKWLPYDGGRDFKMEEMMDYPRWNFNYHLGQISYIQTLYGDKDDH
ncbi:MAG: hypothetical protein HUU60_09615 [Armatimonadetes bacterium]|nr:hypothetical protein [Armatimonadota bacterium]